MYVIYIKRKLRTCRIQIQDEKVWFFEKKHKFWNFSDFDPKGGPFGLKAKNSLFLNFQTFQIFYLKNGLKGS